MNEDEIIETAMSCEPRRVRLLLEGILSREQRRALVCALTPRGDYAAGVLHAFRAQVQQLGLEDEAALLAAVDAAATGCRKDGRHDDG